MLTNEPTLAIVAVHTADNEPLKVLGVIQFNIQFGPSSARYMLGTAASCATCSAASCAASCAHP